MKLFCLLLLSCCWASSTASLDNGAASINRKNVFDSVGTDKCIMECTGELIDAAFNLLNMEDTFNNFQKVCENHEHAISCLAEKHCENNRVFLIMTSGIADICSGKKRQHFLKSSSCLKKHLDRSFQECDAGCNFVVQLAQFSNDPIVSTIASTGGNNPLLLMSRIGPMCDGVLCFLPCIRESLNINCENSGSVMTAAMLRPFYFASKYAHNLSPVIQGLLKTRLPHTCHPLGEKAVLDHIKFGE